MNTHDASATMAVFLDLENMVLGAKRAKFPMFRARKILDRLLAKGAIVMKKAYCDFGNYDAFKRELHAEAFDLIEIPHINNSGKNSADIRLVVDAMDISYRNNHVDTFVIISGDSDFSPLVSKLRENGKKVIGVGVKQSTADLFIRNCDEFIYYDDLVRTEVAAKKTPSAKTPAEKKDATAKKEMPPKEPVTAAKEPAAPAKTPALSVEKAIEELMHTIEVLRGEGGADQVLHAGGIKSTMKRQNPGFDERAYGFRSFSELLREAQKRGLLKLDHQEHAGGLRVLPGE